jgi:hypothetical protein
VKYDTAVAEAIERVRAEKLDMAVFRWDSSRTTLQVSSTFPEQPSDSLAAERGPDDFDALIFPKLKAAFQAEKQPCFAVANVRWADLYGARFAFLAWYHAFAYAFVCRGSLLAVLHCLARQGARRESRQVQDGCCEHCHDSSQASSYPALRHAGGIVRP